VESFDPSLIRSAVPNYFLAELAVTKVKAVLAGEGADELFAGYDYQHGIEGHVDLHDEIVRTVESLHGLNLQRCDRVTMAHGLEARVPFLDLDVIALSLAIPAEWKLHGDGRPEKWILRRAFEDWLPHEVVWREKAEFGDGSGAAVALAAEAAQEAADDMGAVVQLRSKEEAAYYRIFRRHFEGVSPERTITLFATA
jgi:asparagine synthase (glutamine-hydrolysing)